MELDVYQPLAFDITVAPAPNIPITTSPPDNIVGLYAVPGPPGSRGPAGTNSRITGETLTGVRDGVNAYFTTQNIYQPQSTSVYRNGIRELLNVTYYEPADGVIEFDEAPTSYDHIIIDYLIA